MVVLPPVAAFTFLVLKPLDLAPFVVLVLLAPDASTHFNDGRLAAVLSSTLSICVLTNATSVGATLA